MHATDLLSFTGVVSKGHGCGHPTHPGLYMNVTHYRKFIEKHWKQYSDAE